MPSKIVRVVTHAPGLGPKRPADAQKMIDSALRPSVLTKAGLLLNALREWNRLGRPVAARGLREARLRACGSCEFWLGSGNLGLGECRAPGCGCTRLKVFLATERCPHPAGSRWPGDPVDTRG